MPVWLQRGAAWVSVLAMAGLILVQVWRDAQTLTSTTLAERISTHSLTSVELGGIWSLVGAALYGLARVMKKRSTARE